MTNFEFVVSNGAPTRATAAVRSHAVKSGLQRKQSPKEGCTEGKESQLTIRQKSTLTGRFRVTEKNVSSARRKGPKRSEPVDTSTSKDNAVPSAATAGKRQQQQLETWLQSRTPTLKQPNPQQLMDHIPLLFSHGLNVVIKFFLSRLDLNVSIAQISQFWWGFSTSDPLVLHTALGVVASTWAMNVPNTQLAYTIAYKHKALAMPGIRSKLRNNDRSDALIGAIANLAQMEAAQSNYEGTLVHLNALKPLVHVRGGSQAFGDNKEISTSISWPDIIVAVALNTHPMFPLMHDWACVPLPGAVIQAAEQPSLSHMKVFENHPHDATLRYTFSMVRQSYFASQLSGIDYIDLRILFNCVDHRLAAFVAGSEANVAACTLVVAAQIYVQCVMRSSEAGCLLPSLLSLRLVELLRVRLEELLATAEYWNGILWVLTIGMVFTLPYSVEWSFFVSKLLYVTKIAGIVDMVQLEMIVQRFVWDSSQPQLMELLQTNEPFVFGGKTWDELTHSVPSHDFLI